MKDIVIKKARLTDYKRIKEVQKKGYGKVIWGYYALAVGHIVLGARECIIHYKGKPVGFIQYNRTGLSTRHIINICFYPEYQGLGLGGKAMDWLKDKCLEDNVENITLEVRETNEPAKALYKKQGFIEVGRKKCYYKDTGEDAITMKYTSL